MIYRRTYQNNIYNYPDAYKEKKIDVDRLDDEVLKVKHLIIYTNEGTFFANDELVDEVTESLSYYTIKYKTPQLNRIVCLRWTSVYKVEFELLTDIV